MNFSLYLVFASKLCYKCVNITTNLDNIMIVIFLRVNNSSKYFINKGKIIEYLIYQIKYEIIIKNI